MKLAISTYAAIFCISLGVSAAQAEDNRAPMLDTQPCQALMAIARSSQVASERAKTASAAVECFERALSQMNMALDPGNLSFARRAAEIDLAYAVKEAKIFNSQVEFMGLNWGVGFGISVGFGDAIDDAEIVNGIVRVKSDKKQQPRAIFEFHHYFSCNRNHPLTQGCGPFLAVAATEDKLLSGVGIGFMYGLKAKEDSSEGFSIGLGAILDGKVKNLGKGFKANEAPPSGETAVRFEEKARWSALLFVSRTF